MANEGDRATNAAEVSTCERCLAELPAGAAFCPRCGAITSTPGAGPVIPGHTILRILGRGGAAVVYLARQDSLDRNVAVKVLRREVEDPKLWRYFRREAQTIARLSGHPNVVTVYTAGLAAAGQPYLVTEYLERGSLSDVITAEGPLPPHFVIRVGLAVSSALAAAHRLGIHHRDVKPGNVMVDQHGVIKLGDFGIARLLAGQAATTDVVAFTPEHVAPEILRGEPDGPGSDLYGLASTLAEALTGKPVFTRKPGERVESVISRRLSEPPPDLPPTVPPRLARLVRAGLEPDPARRPDLAAFSAQLMEMAGSLDDMVDVEQTDTEPMPPPSPPEHETVIAPAPFGSDAATAAATAAAAAAQRGSIAAALSTRRRRRKAWALPALLLGLTAATLTTALAMNLDDDEATSGSDASIDTSGIDSSAPSADVVVVTVTAPTAANTLVPQTQPDTTPTVEDPPTTPASTSAPPSTSLAPAPATTTPPTATSANTTPATTSSPGTSASTTASVTAPSQPAPGAEVITAAQSADFLRAYYDALDAGLYDTTWAQLAPEFQRGKANSYNYYVGFWDDNDIEIGDIEFVESDANRAVLDVDLLWNGNDEPVTDRFTLRRGDDGGLLIARQD